jgi:predicted DCC family thiol-disulfide oxidoreductase YuxK
MGMPYFSFVMIMGHMSFVRPEWLFELGQWWKRKIGAMEMIYDGRCGFCVRAMAWFRAFVPGLRWQIPFFYIPVLSRLVGHPIYNWVASNRSWLSAFRMKSVPAQPS